MSEPKNYTNTMRAEVCLLDLEEACFRAVKDRRGALGAIAQLNSLKLGTFSHQYNPDYTTHTLAPKNIEMIVHFTKDTRIVDAICAAHGRVGWFHLPDPNCGAGEIMQSIGDMGQDFGSLMQTCMEALADGRISSDELSQLQKSGNQLISAVQGALEQARVKCETHDLPERGFGGVE